MSSRAKSLYGQGARRSGQLASMLQPGRALIAGYNRMAANRVKAQARLAATKARKALLTTTNPSVAHVRTRGSYVPPAQGADKPLRRMLQDLKVQALTRNNGAGSTIATAPDYLIQLKDEADCQLGVASAMLIDVSQLENVTAYSSLYSEVRLNRTYVSVSFPWKAGQNPFPTAAPGLTAPTGGFFLPQLYMYVSSLESDFQTFNSLCATYWTTRNTANATAIENWFEGQTSYQTRIAQGTVTFDFPHTICLQTGVPSFGSATVSPGPVTVIADEYRGFSAAPGQPINLHAPYLFFWMTPCLPAAVDGSVITPPTTWNMPTIRMTVKTACDFRHAT